jgi:hypothetical protein
MTRAGGQGNENATRHGVSSSRRVAPVAANHRRRVLRRLGLRAGEVDAIGRAHLDAYAQIAAKIELLEAYLGEHGIVRADGEPQPVMRLYVSLQNSSRLALTRLESHLRARSSDPHERVQRFLDELDAAPDDAAA